MVIDDALLLVSFLLFGVAIGFFFLLYVVTFRFAESCFTSLISVFGIYYILVLLRTKSNIFGSEEERTEGEGSGSIFDDIFGKKTCEGCGTELVYKEEMDSYYCPECHEYK